MTNKKLGYYTCAGLEFESKIHACLHAVTTGKEVQWYFNDGIFSKHNWKAEPELSLDALYNLRSRQIREKYDYIVLSYSGGADSHNILMSFIRQGLHIDEIVVNNMEKANKQFTDLNVNNKDATNTPAEFRLQTVPRLKEIALQIPRTKITVCDLSDHLFDYMNNAKDASWVLGRKEGLNAANTTRYNYLAITEIRKQFDKNKSMGMIVGVDKPRCFIHDGKFFIRFTDRAANIVPIPNHLNEYTNSTVELYYWSPDSLDILTKQAHIVKRWVEANPGIAHLFDGSAMLADPKIFRIYHEQILKNIVYTTWNENWFQTDKAVKDWTSEFDQWFEDGYSDTRAYGIWLEGVNFVKDKLHTFANHRNGELDGLKLFGKHYEIGSLQIGDSIV